MTDTRNILLAGLLKLICAIALCSCSFSQASSQQTGQAIAKRSKLVGVVFDNSGSMDGRTNLPVFGLQVLAGSLTRDDQLYGFPFTYLTAGVDRMGGRINLSDNAQLSRLIMSLPLSSLGEQQASIDKIRGWARKAYDGTPYLAIDVMLSFLAQTAKPGQDVYLFVFTDGEFNDPIPSPNGLKSAYEAYLAEAKQKQINSFHAHFIAFGNQQTFDEVKRQRVAQTLDEVFNGGTGKYAPVPVQDLAGLRTALLDAITSISDTELPVPGSSIYWRKGNTITVNPPFTISKLIVLAMGANQTQVAQITQSPQKWTGTPSQFRARMDAPDLPSKLPGATSDLWHAQITHMEAYPALPAGQEFSLVFDRPLTDDTTLLFRPDISVDWKIYDSAGNEILPDPVMREITLVAGRDYEVRAQILDKNVSSSPVGFKNLPPGTTFQLRHKDALGRDDLSAMMIDTANSRATYSLHYDTARPDDIGVSLRLPGFVTARSKAVKVKVVITNFDIDVSAEPSLHCPRCSPSHAEATLNTSAPWSRLMKVTAQLRAKGDRKDGQIEWSLASPLPAGLRVMMPALDPLQPKLSAAASSFIMNFKDGDLIELFFEADGNFLSSLPNGYDANLTLKTLGNLRGEAHLKFTLAPNLEAAELVNAGNTKGEPGDTPFRVKLEDLNQTGGSYIKVEKAFQPPRPEDLSISGASGLSVTLEQLPQKELFLIKFAPGSYCSCFMMTGQHSYTVNFKNAAGQTASLQHYMVIEPVTWRERFFICLRIIVCTILVIWFLAGLYRFFQSNRFSSRNRLLIYEGTKREESILKRLARRPLPWIMPFVFPFRPWHERNRVEGFYVQAGPSEILLLPKSASGGYDNLKLQREQWTLSHHFADGVREPFEINWREVIEELPPSKRKFEFIQNPSTDL